MTFLCNKHYMQGTIVAMAAKLSKVILTEYGLHVFYQPFVSTEPDSLGKNVEYVVLNVVFCLCRKKGRGEREVETSRVPADTEEPSLPPAPEKRPGLLPPDPTLWQHVTHARTHVLPLPATGEQVQQLARYMYTCTR